MPNRRVLVGTPAYNGTAEVHYINSLLYSDRLCLKNGIDLHPIWLSYDGLIQRCRNDLLAMAVKDQFDDLVFIDADITWDPPQLLKLLQYPVDVVGGTYRKKTDAEEIYTVKAGNPNLPRDPSTGLMVVDGLGTGFLRVSRKAMLAVWDQAEPYQDQRGETRWVFDVRPINGKVWGEDTIFCMKLAECGFPVHLDPAITCGHIGIKKFEGNFGKYLSRLQGQ
ncbi:MAG: hypothetical protein Q7S17_07770 [Xanthobacteraceae bacterium]|nr:hypothetical protein [Xanthobacteraceae bacterium]